MTEDLENKLTEEEEKSSSSGKKKKLKKKDVEDYDIFSDDPRSEDPEERKEEKLDDISAIHEFRECNKVSKHLRTAFFSWLVVVLATFLFLAGSYLIYNHDINGTWDVRKKNHEHVWDMDNGLRTEGDCKHKGYVTYACTVPYCDEKLVVSDSYFGQHQYPIGSEVIIERDGVQYKQYICYLCQHERLVPVTDEEDK